MGAEGWRVGGGRGRRVHGERSVAVRHSCNTAATQLQHSCNTAATQVQHRCNTGATQVQHSCADTTRYGLGALPQHDTEVYRSHSTIEYIAPTIRYGSISLPQYDTEVYRSHSTIECIAPAVRYGRPFRCSPCQVNGDPEEVVSRMATAYRDGTRIGAEEWAAAK